MVTVAQLVKMKHLTKKQGANLKPKFALVVGLKNKKKNHSPKPSLPTAVWKAKEAARRANKGKGKKGKK